MLFIYYKNIIRLKQTQEYENNFQKLIFIKIFKIQMEKIIT